MTVRLFVIGSLLAIVVSVGAWGLILTQLAPSQAGGLGFVLFFLSMFVAVASVSGLLGYFVRRLLLRGQLPAYAVRTSLRQGLMVAGFASLLLFLQLIQLYRWWVAIAMIAILGSLELVFLSYDRSNRRSAGADQI
ncbi:hypothetical protein CL628_04735 [bacterium]|nr:hypothetical protein [bacterium]